MSNCVVHISVQLLSPVQLATRMVIDQHLLHVMLSSLMHMMSEILTEPSASGTEAADKLIRFLLFFSID